MDSPTRIRELIDRLARVAAAEERSDALNPAQHAALAYLARANRLSRAPSTVADYLCTTRGTASQTLKALERKGFVAPTRSSADKRSIAYEVTRKGARALDDASALDAAIADLSAPDSAALEAALEGLAGSVLAERGFRSFGICRTCKHHRAEPQGATCTLLDLSLSESDAGELCHEHEAAATRPS